jgi:hypothetical protein
MQSIALLSPAAAHEGSQPILALLEGHGRGNLAKALVDRCCHTKVLSEGRGRLLRAQQGAAHHPRLPAVKDGQQAVAGVQSLLLTQF